MKAIAVELGRSPTVVSNYLKNPRGYGQKKKGGRPSVFTKQDKDKIISMAKSGNYFARDIKLATKVKCSLRTIQYVLQDCDEVVFAKKKKAPMLLQRHMVKRKEFAEYHLSNETPWSKIIFSDEKKFNLDGPDGFAYYWHAIGEEEKIFSRRQAGGGSVMVWGGVSDAGKTELMICEGKIDSKKYCEILDNALIPFLTSRNQNQQGENFYAEFFA